MAIVTIAFGVGVIDGGPVSAGGQPAVGYEYRVLATNRTSTMEKELNEAAESGFRFQAVMGGETGGGNEVVVVIVRRSGQP